MVYMIGKHWCRNVVAFTFALTSVRVYYSREINRTDVLLTCIVPLHATYRMDS